MRSHVLCLLAVLSIAGQQPALGSPIRMTLALHPPRTLPGIPVTFRVEAVNTADVAAILPQWVVLEVTPESGQPFLTVAGIPRSEQRAALLVDEDERSLGAGEIRRLDFWAGPESPPWWAGPFWLEPGNYSLRLIAGQGLEKHGSDVLTLEEAYLVDPIISNATVLTIEVPSGVDAEVWAPLRKP